MASAVEADLLNFVPAGPRPSVQGRITATAAHVET